MDMNQIPAYAILDLYLSLLAYRHTTYGQQATHIYGHEPNSGLWNLDLPFNLLA